MQYATGQTIKIGDEVIADGMKGVVVCDFDNRKFAEGYETLDMPTIEMLGGGTLSSGVMIETVEAGMIHYVDGIGVIDFVQPASR
ncbi:hypothetical protein C7I87_12730 [Mesorhizobium sp. SARCC-RB16n]|uniref:hypothetical protein n=1 Tax=Mesorhizobium sp. SARCC-RB16n TaxID=2116687 RepID=UPI00122EB999|nr:hypothetical protein [Mesorhizobium sp. SARCC-RB16n]KAA3450471.1 hypothetical protein C7I87_12730 [Mesorhizobium sp. SARCC-RB16n]